tara:strand:+ start:129 stop:383 length:255 start_codon:yes stop_codon:yes gene_type:complete
MIYQGFGWGVGSSLGRAATASILGGGQGGYATDASPKSDARAVNPCDAAAEAFGRCVRDNAEDLARCQTLADAFQSCTRGETMG